MSERTTRAAVDALAVAVTRLLPQGDAVRAEGRYGYTALDLHRLDGDSWHPVRTLYAGTKGEVATYLRAMREALLLHHNPTEKETP